MDLKFDNMVYGKILRSEVAYGEIVNIDIPKLEDGYEVITYKDVPGENEINNDHKTEGGFFRKQPIFAEKEVNFIGEPILMVVGPDEDKLNSIIQSIKVTYNEKEPVVLLEKAEDAFSDYKYEKGNIEEAFKNADKIIEDTYCTGYQEQAYLDMQGAIAIYNNDKLTVYSSMQCPYYVKGSLTKATGLSDDKVQVILPYVGGGFGGKEDYPSVVSTEAAVAAMKIGKPVRLAFKRREDMDVTTKRHPSIIKHRTALDKDNNIIGMDIDIKLDAGAYVTVSSFVLQRAMICANGVYNVPNLKVRGRALMTNRVPTGAFRGFGGPQSIFAVEMHVDHIARELGIDPIEYKKRFFVKKGDVTSTSGIYHEDILLDDMVKKIEEVSDYSNKYNKYKHQTGRYRKGIGISLFPHGCGFTGSGERDLIKAVVRIEKYKDNTVEVFVSNSDIGQGLRTTFAKIAAEVLEIPIERVKVGNPDTDRVPNSGPTVASRSLMIVGKLVERGCKKLKEQWIDNEYQVLEEHYQHPDLIPWDLDKFSGDAYPTFAWAVNVVEVEVDTLVGTTDIKGVWGVFDIGTPIDNTIVKGQLEGGMLQGIGYASSEVMESLNGKLKQNSFTDYIIPTAKDTIPFETIIIDNPYFGGPFGAKGLGEVPLIGMAPAYVSAIESAVQHNFNNIPLNAEKIMEVL